MFSIIPSKPLLKKNFYIFIQIKSCQVSPETFRARFHLNTYQLIILCLKKLNVRTEIENIATQKVKAENNNKHNKNLNEHRRAIH